MNFGLSLLIDRAHGLPALSGRPLLFWTLIGADLMIAAANVAILWATFRYPRRQCLRALSRVALLFGLFILVRAVTHLVSVWTLWVPSDIIQASASLLTASVSLVAAMTMWRLLPSWMEPDRAEQLRSNIARLEAEVSARRTAEEGLRDAQDALAKTLAGIGAGFIATDANGRVTHLNEIGQRLVGWRESEARGEILWKVFVCEGRTQADTELNPVDVYVQEGVSVDTSRDLVLIDRRGRSTPVRATVTVTRDDFAVPRSIALVLRDQSGELAAETALSRLAAIVESSCDAIIGKSLQGRITSWNPGAQDLFGYTAEEAIGQSMQMLIPSDRANEEEVILARITRGERVDHFETVRRRKDGSLVNISATISPVRDASGRIIGASKIARDFTQRRQADLRLMSQLQRLRLLDQITRAIGARLDPASIYQVAVRSLADELPSDICCVMTREGPSNSLVVVSASGELEKAFLSTSSVVTVDSIGLSRCLQGELVYEPDVAAVNFPFPQRMAAAGFRSLVAAPLHSDDQIFGVLLAGRRGVEAFSSGECEFVRQLGTHVALAANQARLHEQLQAAFDELSRSQQAAVQQERLRALGQMASGITHDINNALSPAMLYAESMLSNEPLSERARDQLQHISRAVDDVAATVSRLREFYRTGESQVALQPVSLNALAKRVIEISHARWSDMPQERGNLIEVLTELDPDVPVVWAIESEVRDALVNLVFNAVDAMPDGGTLTMRTRLQAASSIPDANAFPARVAVEVSDSGIGMDDHTRLHCLEPFFTTKGERGTGLGLAMVYGAVKRHGAEIKIESRLHRGSTFTLLFPLLEQPVAPTIEAPLARPVVPLRILLVDDDPALLHSLRDTLGTDGHAISVAEGGKSGIELFAVSVENGQPFDLVITDLGMPRVDGRSVAAAVKNLSEKTPVVMLTGWGQRMVEDGGTPAHVDMVLSKPPKLKDLRAAILEFHPKRERLP